MFIRVPVDNGSRIPAPMRAGDGFAANVAPTSFAAETDETITLAQLSGAHLVQGTTLTSDVVYTLPTAALIAAEAPEMDIGDAYSFYVGNNQAGAFDVVIAVDTGITAVGANNTLSVPPQAGRLFVLVKTAAATYDLY